MPDNWSSRPLAALAEPKSFAGWLTPLYRQEWVVYAKPPFGGPEQVLKYLARYTHRVAISNQRLLSLEDGQVTFRYKDYADDQQAKILRLSTAEFIRRFLMHTLPSRFIRIRYFGLLANRNRDARLEKCRCLLGVVAPGAASPDQDAETPADTPGESLSAEICPVCQRGTLVRIDLPRPAIGRRRHAPTCSPARPLRPPTSTPRSHRLACSCITGYPSLAPKRTTATACATTATRHVLRVCFPTTRTASIAPPSVASKGRNAPRVSATQKPHSNPIAPRSVHRTFIRRAGRTDCKGSSCTRHIG